jgi:methionyl-tRNA formyltransferase
MKQLHLKTEKIAHLPVLLSGLPGATQEGIKMNARCLRFVLRKSSFARLTPYSFRFYSTESTTTAGGDNAKVVKESKPLRILFCGSDEFSIMSLNLLCEERKRNPELIESIDVLVRPAKPVGRNLKTLRPGW